MEWRMSPRHVTSIYVSVGAWMLQWRPAFIGHVVLVLRQAGIPTRPLDWHHERRKILLYHTFITYHHKINTIIFAVLVASAGLKLGQWHESMPIYQCHLFFSLSTLQVSWRIHDLDEYANFGENVLRKCYYVYGKWLYMLRTMISVLYSYMMNWWLNRLVLVYWDDIWWAIHPLSEMLS